MKEIEALKRKNTCRLIHGFTTREKAPHHRNGLNDNEEPSQRSRRLTELPDTPRKKQLTSGEKLEYRLGQQESERLDRINELIRETNASGTATPDRQTEDTITVRRTDTDGEELEWNPLTECEQPIRLMEASTDGARITKEISHHDASCHIGTGVLEVQNQIPNSFRKALEGLDAGQ